MSDETWVWPFYPCSAGRYSDSKNLQAPKMDVREGQTIDLQIGKRPAVSNFITGEVHQERILYGRYYRPSADELALMERCFPGLEPGNPSWPQIEAELIVAGHSIRELSAMSAPTLLRFLEKSRSGQSNASVKSDERSCAEAPADQASIAAEWRPPAGYVGRKTICTHIRFKKRGKNPSPTTIDAWVKRAKDNGQPIDIEKDPANRENHYPEAWVMERIKTWNPRTSAT